MPILRGIGVGAVVSPHTAPQLLLRAADILQPNVLDDQRTTVHTGFPLRRIRFRKLSVS